MSQTNSQLDNTSVQAFLNDLDKKLWQSADSLRKNLDAANYKHIVLGFIFLKYISDSFIAHREHLKSQFSDPEHELYLDPDFFDETQLISELEQREYYTKDNIFWVPQKARWDEIKALSNANIGDELPWNKDKDKGGKFKGIAILIDDAFEAIEQENPKLKGVLQRISSYSVSESTLIGLVNTFSNTSFTQPTHNGDPIHLQAKDILGHVYEYFLGEFALAEGKKGGQYFTPKSIVTLIVEMLEPYQGRIYDPAMGSGGFFVSADRFIAAHQGNRNAISIYGQESNPTTRKLAVMNMAIRGIDFDFGDRPEDTLLKPLHIDKKMDFVMANPPFNMKDWGNDSIDGDPRWAYGTPPHNGKGGNANFAWLQHMIYHLNEKGKMALLLANGSMSSNTNNEGEIRKNIVNADLVECMIALPGQLFTNTQIPACIWLLNKAKTNKGKVLFIDARNIGYMKDRVLRDFTTEDITHITNTYHQWQKQPLPEPVEGNVLDNEQYANQAGFCYSATLEEIAKNDYILTAGRYVGAEAVEDDGIPFAEKMQDLTALLKQQFEQGRELEAQIVENLEGLGYE